VGFLCFFLFAAEKERKKTDEKTPKASLLRFRTVMASRYVLVPQASGLKYFLKLFFKYKIGWTP
jgi:hypothetical protein